MKSLRLTSLRSTKIPLGLLLIYYSIGACALATLAMFILPLSGFPAWGGTLILAAITVFFVAGIVSFAGKLLCLTAPDEMSRKAAIYVAVGLDVLAIGIGIAGQFVSIPPPIAGSTNLLSIAGMVAFLVFLRSLAVFVTGHHETDLALRADVLLKIGVALVLMMLGSIVCVFVFPVGAGLLAIVAVVLGLVGFLRYIRLLHDLAEAIR